MPECHVCQHNGKASSACLKCAGAPETNHRGREFVSLDCGEAEANQTLKRRISTSGRPPEINLPDCCCDAVHKLMAALFQLDNGDISLVRHLLAGGSLADFARTRKLTRQAVWARLRNIAHKHREFAALFKAGWTQL